MSYNKEQLESLQADIHSNVVVSAGAGSGKTRTLTKKVINILTGEGSEKLEPSELLILTFTNNAAHDMKRKIVEACKDIPNINDLISSAHIQTFDSFSNDLVKKYSSRLGVSDNLNVISEEIKTSNIKSYIDDIFEEYENRDDEQLIKSLIKTSLKDDENFKSVVYKTYVKMQKMMPDQRKEYIKNCKEKFFDRAYFDEMVNKWVESIKADIRFEVKYADLLNSYPYAFMMSEDVDKINEFYLDKSHFEKDYRKCFFMNNTDLQDGYNYIVDLLELNGMDFLNEANYAIRNLTKKNALFGKTIDKDEDLCVKQAYDIFKKIFSTKKSCLEILKDYGEYKADELDPTIHTYSLDNEYLKILSFKDDIGLVFEIISKIDERVDKLQKTTGSYTFGDISSLALKLIKENDDIANELREQFKFIMIDEYQDTNDLQEQFIDLLLKPRKSDVGTASLFCVGDSKQSIYAFRNSNVALFNKRLNDPTTKKIFMNKNYRSGEKLLREINHIFKCYMQKCNGDIEYLKNNESLQYDKDVNIYSAPYDGFGVKRITLEDNETISADEYECYAIINDIKNKMNDPDFLISERSSTNILRRAKYSDFCILMRTKKGFDLYRRIFAKEGIKLNLVYSEDLQQADAIMAIRSLVSLVAQINNDVDNVDVSHAFISVVRSFLFQYSDQQILDLLTNNGTIDNNSLSRIYSDPVYLKIKDFAHKNKNESFHNLALHLFDEFDIFNKLILIGSVNDNIAKIESLYKTILSEEEIGENIKDFLYFLKNMEDRNLGFNSDVEIQMDGAVSMMSIHASKGLEKKIIYMPYTFNKRGGEAFGEEYVGDFTDDFGIILPMYTNDVSDEKKNMNTLYEIMYQKFRNEKAEMDEHARLFYVALTRSENMVYIVGNKQFNDSKEREKGTLYGMLSYMPCWPKITSEGLDILSRRINPSFYNLEIEPYINNYKKTFAHLYYKDFKDDESYYFYISMLSIKSEYFEGYITEHLEKSYILLFESLFTELENRFNSNNLGVDLLAKIFGAYQYKIFVDNFDDLIQKLLAIKESLENKYLDESGLSESISTFDIETDRVKLTDILNDFGEKLVHARDNLDCFIAGEEAIKLKMEYASHIRHLISNQNTPLEIMDLMLIPCLYALENTIKIYEMTYQADDYEDEHYEFSIDEYDRKLKVEVPKDLMDNVIIDSDNSPIEFEERFKRRASKSFVDNKDEEIINIMEKGTLYHKYMELVDFKTKDTSFIKNQTDRDNIDKVLKMDLFNEINKADKVFKEYPYYDDVYETYGFIDLLYIKDGEYYVIDFKLKHTDDDGYQKQLETYKRNLKTLFNVDDSKIHTNLLSLLECKIY